MTSQLTEDYIPFGKYCGQSLSTLLKDRYYCSWLLSEPFFKNYSYLYQKVKDWNPKVFFLPENQPATFIDHEDFIKNFSFFNLTSPENLKIFPPLPSFFLISYNFYLNQIQTLKNKLIINSEKDNVYDIKAPSKFLKQFEKETSLERTVFKTFLYQYDLPNILEILEIIKSRGNLTYNGRKGWLIAKQRSVEQERWWEIRLKEIFGDAISCQFAFKGCIFDFIHIKKNIIFEAKLNIKDFDEIQYNNYLLTIDNYEIIYLIQTNTIIHTHKKIIYTEENKDIFILKQSMKKSQNLTKFDFVIKDFEIITINNISEILKLL